MNEPLQENRLWYDSRMRSIGFQIFWVLLVVGLIYYLYRNTQANLERQSIATGFEFVSKEAGFGIGESVITYSAADTYFRAFLVGAINTVKVSVIGIVLSLLLGTIVGIARLSSNWLVARLAAIYVEGFRNIPLLLQLFFLYAMFTETLPHPRKALEPVSGVFLCNRGLYFPILEKQPAFLWIGISIIIAFIAAWIIRWRFRRIQNLSGKRLPAIPVSIVICLGIPLVTWLCLGMPWKIDVPHLQGFNFKGGLSVSPEFGALLLGLVLYTGAFIAEVVRSGIQSVSHGQTEAAMALGLKNRLVLNLVILPQALRVIIPPLTNQVLNLIKNSSLAVGIGYPDFVSVANTSINQTGQAIECVTLIMVFYLFFSLITSVLMNWYNKRKALVGT